MGNDRYSLIFDVRNTQILPGHAITDSYTLPLPHSYLSPEDLPKRFSWGGNLTHSLNQVRIPPILSIDLLIRLILVNGNLTSCDSTSHNTVAHAGHMVP